MILPVYRLTLRALLLQRRTIMLAVVVLAPVATSLIYALARPAGSDTVDFYSGIVQKLFVPAVAALVALVFGVSAFGDEREDGTILYLVATPQPRLELVVAKVAAAWTASLVLLVPSLVLQPLMENAIEHGGQDPDGLHRVRLDCRLDGGMLRIEIENPEPG